MPYIKEIDKKRLREPGATPRTAGEMNFLFTVIADTYIQEHGRNYQNMNDVMGALEGAKQEFYRRVAVAYEEMKITENGDVYS